MMTMWRSICATRPSAVQLQDTFERVILLSKNTEDYMNAANTPVAERTQAQKDLVTAAHKVGMQAVKNADFKTQNKK